MKKYFLYILRSEKNNSYYIGTASDVNRRIREHNSEKVKSTKSGIPWILKYREYFDTLPLARKREQQIKSWKKRSAIEKLIHGAFV